MPIEGRRAPEYPAAWALYSSAGTATLALTGTAASGAQPVNGRSEETITRCVLAAPPFAAHDTKRLLRSATRVGRASSGMAIAPAPAWLMPPPLAASGSPAGSHWPLVGLNART